MKKHDTPAFPTVSELVYSEDQGMKIHRYIYASEGMTRREYFAGLAMMGSLASEASNWQHTPARHAAVAVACADALLAALEASQ